MYSLTLLSLLFAGLVLLYKAGLVKQFDHPLVLVTFPILFCICILVGLDTFGIISPTQVIGPSFTLFLVASFLCLSLPFTIKTGMLGEFYVSNNLASMSYLLFRVTAFLGICGTIGLLGGIVSDFSEFMILLQYNPQELDQKFFNSSYALLWQANIACLFWFSLGQAHAKKIDYVLISLSIFSVGLRFAFAYLVIAAFYFLIPKIATGRFKFKQIIMYAVFGVFVINSLIIFGYNFDGDVIRTYFLKIYPYTAGNIVNLQYHFEDSFPVDMASMNGWAQVLEALGFNSILIYLNKYFGLNVDIDSRMVFFQQVSNAHVYGNTHTIFGQLIYLPTILYFLYLTLFGLVLKIVHVMSRRNFIFLVIHCWFSAACFLSFAGAGHFTTTRFFPALLFVFPLYYFIYYFYRRIKI